MGSGWEEKVGGFVTDRRGRKKVRDYPHEFAKLCVGSSPEGARAKLD